MILAMNIGNTNFSLGALQDCKIRTIRHPVGSFGSPKCFSKVIRGSINELGLKKENVAGVIISSVNPGLTGFLEGAIKELFQITALAVVPSMNMELDLSYYDVSLIGSDRIAVCEAAISKYGRPSIVFDFGTATTINVVDENGYFMGGSILPGLMMGINALTEDTAQLPRAVLTSQVALVGHNTRECIISGAVFGNAAMLDGMAARIESFLGKKPAVIITGGNASCIAPVCRTKVIHNPDLLLEGLCLLYQNNVV